LQELFFAGDDVDAIEVVILPLAAVVDADDDLLGGALADGFDLGGDFLNGRQVFDIAGVEIDAIDVVVFVAVLVLRIENVLARECPGILNYPAVLVEGYGLGLRGIVIGADPDIQHTLDRGDKGDSLAVGTQAHAGLFGIAEEGGAGDQGDVAWA